MPKTRGTKMKATKNKTGRKDLKLKRDPLPRGSLREMLQQGAGSSGEPLRGPVATSAPAVEISAKGRNEPVVQNLPERHLGQYFLESSDYFHVPMSKILCFIRSTGLLRE
jgi:hypothetical protein